MMQFNSLAKATSHTHHEDIYRNFREFLETEEQEVQN